MSIIKVFKAVGLALALSVRSLLLSFATPAVQQAEYVLGYQTLDLLISCEKEWGVWVGMGERIRNQ